MEAELKRLAVTSRTSTYSGICKEYLEDCSARMRANTVQEKFSHYSHFAQYIRTDVAAATITLDHAKAYPCAVQGSKGNKVANRYLRNLKALWNWHRDKIFTNPWTSVRAYPEEGFVKYVPPQEDVAVVLLAASPLEREFLNVILKTEARLGKVMKLRWEDVNFERGFITLWTRKRKGGQMPPRSVPMLPGTKLFEIIQRRWASRGEGRVYVFTNPLTGDMYGKNQHSINLMLKRLCERAGVKHFGFHALRHYVSWRLMDSGKCSVADIQHLLGHQRTTTTETYLKSFMPNMDKLGAVLDEETDADAVVAVPWQSDLAVGREGNTQKVRLMCLHEEPQWRHEI